MVNFFLAGGYPMWFVLLFSVLALVTAATFVRRGQPRSLATLRALTAATVLVSLGGAAGDFTAVMFKAPARHAYGPDLTVAVMNGLGEAVTPITLGFGLLSIAWLLVAVRLRKGDDPST